MVAQSRYAVGPVEVDPGVLLVQLPFPSQEDPLPALSAYYELYNAHYSTVFPEYAVGTGDLWEAPLWVAHLDGAIGKPDTMLVDLSRTPFDVEACVHGIERAALASPKAGAQVAARAGAKEWTVFLSPLAQNFALAVEVSRRLMSRGVRTVLGGNMADLASPDDFTHVHSGIVKRGILDEITGARPGRTASGLVRLGKQKEPIGYAPTYRLLEAFRGRVPLVRLNASHGCLFACTFCGDAWSRQLHLVTPELLAAEVDEVRRAFPDTRILYIGDKSFGQSPAAVENLRRVLRPEYGFRLIVQTHVSLITPALVDTMVELGVEVVEIGFETASSTVLHEMKKGGGARAYQDAVALLHARGLHVILNVLGGLPSETAETQAETLHFMEEISGLIWLYNLYNFVPYPKTPLYPSLKSRIVDWNFQQWREDRPVVFEPYHQSREAAWEHFLRLVECATRLVSKRTTSAKPLSVKPVSGKNGEA